MIAGNLLFPWSGFRVIVPPLFSPFPKTGRSIAMTGARRRICALGLILFFLIGCTAPDSLSFLYLQNGSKGGDRVIAASVDTVSHSLQASLSDLGMVAEVSKKGDDILIASKTATGTRFTLVLTKDKTKDREQTRVRIEWENGKDEEMGFQILSQVESRLTH
jgi:hypothetical protein